jgi:tetratricopeptide (TPR) repeat protein
MPMRSGVLAAEGVEAGGSTLGMREVHGRRGRTGGVLLLVLLLVASGCAIWRPTEYALPSPVAQETSPELDFLIARDLEGEGRLEEALEAYKRALSKDPESVYLLKRVGELSARQNRLSDAVVYAERALDLEPDNEGVRLFLGTLYRFRKDVPSAERVLRDEAGLPVSREAALVLYGIYVDNKRLSDARNLAEWMIDTRPDELRGYFALADAHEKLGDPAASEATLRTGLEKHPGELALYNALARGRRGRGDRVGEIAIYREMLEIRPNHRPTLQTLAEAQLALERTDEAVETLEILESLYPGDLRARLRLAFIEFGRGNFEAAAERFEFVLQHTPEEYEVVYFLGVTRRRLGEDGAAIAAFERIPNGHDRYAEARTQIAAIWEQRGDLPRAIAEVERARVVQESRPLDLYLASLRAEAGDLDWALEFLQRLLDESPDDAEILYNIGVIHGEAKQIDEAIRYMQLVLGMDPDHAGALNYVGYTWAERGTNLDQAEEMISRALELRPDDGYITDSLGWVYFMRARPLLEEGKVEAARVFLDRAVDELQRAAELTGGDPVISEHLGDVYLLLDQKERALSMYEEALQLAPRFEEQPKLREKYEQLREELGAR